MTEMMEYIFHSLERQEREIGKLRRKTDGGRGMRALVFLTMCGTVYALVDLQRQVNALRKDVDKRKKEESAG